MNNFAFYILQYNSVTKLTFISLLIIIFLLPRRVNSKMVL